LYRLLQPVTSLRVRHLLQLIGQYGPLRLEVLMEVLSAPLEFRPSSPGLSIAHVGNPLLMPGNLAPQIIDLRVVIYIASLNVDPALDPGLDARDEAVEELLPCGGCLNTAPLLKVLEHRRIGSLPPCLAKEPVGHLLAGTDLLERQPQIQQRMVNVFILFSYGADLPAGACTFSHRAVYAFSIPISFRPLPHLLNSYMPEDVVGVA